MAKFAISAGGMTEIELFGALDVIKEDIVVAVFQPGELEF